MKTLFLSTLIILVTFQFQACTPSGDGLSILSSESPDDSTCKDCKKDTVTGKKVTAAYCKNSVTFEGEGPETFDLGLSSASETSLSASGAECTNHGNANLTLICSSHPAKKYLYEETLLKLFDNNTDPRKGTKVQQTRRRGTCPGSEEIIPQKFPATVTCQVVPFYDGIRATSLWRNPFRESATSQSQLDSLKNRCLNYDIQSFAVELCGQFPNANSTSVLAYFDVSFNDNTSENHPEGQDRSVVHSCSKLVASQGAEECGGDGCSNAGADSNTKGVFLSFPSNVEFGRIEFDVRMAPGKRNSEPAITKGCTTSPYWDVGRKIRVDNRQASYHFSFTAEELSGCKASGWIGVDANGDTQVIISNMKIYKK